MYQVETGANLSEVLTHLVNEVSQYVERAAIFIVKGNSAIGRTAAVSRQPTRSSSSTSR